MSKASSVSQNSTTVKLSNIRQTHHLRGHMVVTSTVIIQNDADVKLSLVLDLQLKIIPEKSRKASVKFTGFHISGNVSSDGVSIDLTDCKIFIKI